VFGGGKIPCYDDGVQTSAATPGVNVLVAPRPMSMGDSCSESFFSALAVPSQVSMTTAANMIPSALEDENAWWSSTVNQVFALWSNDQLAHEPWCSDPMNLQWR